MSTAHFVVPLADLEDGPKAVSWELSPAWLARVLEGTDAQPRQPGQLELELSKSGSEVLVRGRAQVSVTMTCTRSLEPMEVVIEPDIFLMLAQAQEPTRGRGARRGGSAGARGRSTDAKQPHAATSAKIAGKGTSRRGGGWSDDPELSKHDAAQDVFRGERVELDEFIREFILLELPMTPMRSDLRNAPEPASARAPAEPAGAKPVDPRLAPLAAIASRLREQKDKE